MHGRLDRIIELAELAGQKDDPRLRHLIRRLMVRPDQRLEEFLLKKLTLQAGDCVIEQPAFRTISSAEMDFVAGVPYVRWGHAARFERGELVEADAFRFPLIAGHRLITGSTRSGKSCAIAKMVEGLPAETSVWLIDPENDHTYASLALSAGFEVIDILDLKRNLLEPPSGCDRQVWYGHFKRNCRESLFLRDGSISMISALLEHCTKDKGAVSLRDLYDALIALRFRLAKQGREYSFFETLKNRCESLLTNKIFDCTRGFDLGALASRNVLFRCAGLGSDEYPLLVNDFVSWLGCYFRPEPNPVPRMVVVVEELHRLTNPQRLRRADIAEPIVLDAVRTLAKRRVSLWCVDQVPSSLPTEILANVSFRAVFYTFEGRDLDALQRSMGFNHDQRIAVSRLAQRCCVVQYANHLFSEPFPVVIDEFALGGNADADVDRRRAQTLAAMSWEASSQAAPAQAQAEARPPLLSKAAIDYLIEAAKDPFMAATARDEALGIAISQGNAIRSELEAAGAIELVRVRTFGKSRRITNTKITDKGYVLLREMKVAAERPRGKGGWEHAFHQSGIAKWAKRNGYDARIEHMHDGKSVDVALEREGRRMAVEVLVNGVAKEIANVRDLCSGFDEIWFCVPSNDEAAKLTALIRETFGAEAAGILERSRFRLLKEFQPGKAPAARRGADGDLFADSPSDT